MSAPQPLPPHLRQQIEEVRGALLRVHKALLDAERVDYEGEHGRVESSGAFLQLALHNSRFAWLHPLLALVVQLDELLATNDAADAHEVAVLIDQARSILKLDEEGGAFHRRYRELLQDEPGVVMAHAHAMSVLRRG
jgi:hypothetical protein